ncbi:hypothetical protein OJAV_G00043400 [Oryzias javanicus]|uniref:Uncharacterized protein n=1 Tax=Oryzias javanicus TaxID=123683 RepID=A0A437DDG2_ORYJA|nr:hypothetical protein OJAV_G00043400 [Oryzias javanicus]
MRLQRCPGGMLELLSNPAHRFNNRHRLRNSPAAILTRSGVLRRRLRFFFNFSISNLEPDSTQLRRLRSSSAFRGEAAVPPNQKES